MGGERIDRADETGEIEELGSVGDWRLPSWMPRISGLAWLFIGLGILGFVEPLVAGFGWMLSFTPDKVVAAITRALPILIPAAALWRTKRPRPRSLLLGSVAVGIGAVITSGFAETWVGIEPVFGGGGLWQPITAFEVPWVITIAFTFVGPVLLANVPRAVRQMTSRRRAIGAGLAVGAITVGYLAMTVVFPVYLYQLYVNDPSYPGDWFGTPVFLSVMPSALLGWAYFAWAILTGDADSRRRPAWRMATAGVVIQQGLVALNFATMAFWYVVARGDQDTPLADAALWISGAVFFVTPILLIVATTLLIAAFAVGFANSKAVEPEGPPVELEPIPNPG